ncbi:MAG: hypothetical protein ACLP1X_19850 [Polyangiaceae bacterium]
MDAPYHPVLAGFSSTVWRAYRRMMEEGLTDHLILIVAAQGRIHEIIRPREECWRELLASVGRQADLPPILPARPPGTCWVVLVDDKPGGTRFQVAWFDGDIGLARATRNAAADELS